MHSLEDASQLCFFFCGVFFFLGTGAGNGGRIVRWTLACSACTETWALWCFSEHTCCLIREHTKQQMRHPGVSKWFQDKSHHHVIILVYVYKAFWDYFFCTSKLKDRMGGFSAPLLFFFSSTLIVCVMWRLQCGRELFWFVAATVWVGLTYCKVIHSSSVHWGQQYLTAAITITPSLYICKDAPTAYTKVSASCPWLCLCPCHKDFFFITALCCMQKMALFLVHQLPDLLLFLLFFE